MINLLKPLSFLVALSLCACGGGSSESSDKGEGTDNPISPPPINSYTPETVPEARKAEFELYLSTGFLAQAINITGVYKVEHNGDITYVSIQTKGQTEATGAFNITAYNFLGDDQDKSADCYTPAREGDLNYFINTGTGFNSIGAALRYKNQFQSVSGAPVFAAQTPVGELVYSFDVTTNKLVSMSLNGRPSSSSEILDTENRVALTIVKDDPELNSTILAFQCKGAPAVNAPGGFSGLYDTSLTLDNQRLENYLYIDSDGVITNWRYKGDGFSPKDVKNCYQRGDWYNNRLFLQELLYDAEGNFLFVEDSLFELRWFLDAEGKVTSVGMPQPTDDATSATIVDLNLNISSTKAKLTLGDLEQMECE